MLQIQPKPVLFQRTIFKHYKILAITVLSCLYLLVTNNAHKADSNFCGNMFYDNENNLKQPGNAVQSNFISSDKSKDTNATYPGIRNSHKISQLNALPNLKNVWYPKNIPFNKENITALPSSSTRVESVNLEFANNKDLPPLEVGMVNVTDNKAGYKVQSNNNNPKLLAIKFLNEDIPAGYTIGDVHTYFYNKNTSHWNQLKRDSLDVTNNIVYSTNTEDGDYINAIIKAPESPETQGYTPTSMKAIKFGDPSSMIQIIQPPTINNQGSSNINFHIETPKGRQGMEPNLDVIYSSDGVSGVLGEGWSLSGISAITVETKWGVPQYSSIFESETYLLDGKMLAMSDDNGNLTMPHRTLNISRNNGTKRFYPRQENNFNKIERVGSLNNYVWIITDKNGTKYYYGGITTNDADAELRNGNKIAEWKLRKVEDLFKNSIEYIYEPQEKNLNGNSVKSIFLKKIQYAIYQNNKALKDFYELNFEYDKDQETRKDFNFNARYGFLSSVNSKLLESIKVTSVNYGIDGNLEEAPLEIRKYNFKYSYGSYDKIVLDSISQFGYDGNTEQFFYSQKFRYFKIDSLKGKYFTDISIPMPSEGFLGQSVTKAKLGFGGAVGIGLPDFQFLSKSLSFNAQFSYKENESEAQISLVDINGDSKPDIVRNQGGRISYKPNTSSFDRISFGAEHSIIGLNGFSKDEGSSYGIGAEVNGPTQSRVYGGYDQNTTNSYSKYYFTDANGDGLIDVVENGEVHFNTYNGQSSQIDFKKSSANTESPISSGGAISTDLIQEDASRIATELRNNITISPLHDVVKIWIAPDSGIIKINAPVQLVKPVINPNDPSAEEDSLKFKKSDGVWVSIQQNSSNIFNPLQIPRGDFSIKPIDNIISTTNKGDKILFRVQSGNVETANGDFDQVSWNPTITYTSKNNDRHFIDAFGKNQFEFNALNDYLNTTSSIDLPDSGNYIISGQLTKPSTKDAITLKIKISGSIVKDSFPDSLIVKRNFGADTTIKFTNYTYTHSDSIYSKILDTSKQTFSTNFLVPQKYLYNTTLSFEVTPSSNFDLTEIKWKPKVVYNYYDTTETMANKKWKKDSLICFPKMNFRGYLVKPGIYIKVRDSGNVKISPIISLNPNKKTKATLIISDKAKIIAKKEITQSTYLTDTISFARDKNQLFTISYEIDNLDDIDISGTTGRTPSYLLIPNDFKNWIVPQTGKYNFYSVRKGAIASSFLKRNGADSLPQNRDTLKNIFLNENDVISFIDTTSKKEVAFSTILTQASAVFSNWDLQDYGSLYRGWGQGTFNATNYLNRPIDVSLFKLDQTQKKNFYETQFFSMPQNGRDLHYTGANNRIYINKDTFSSSRLAMSNVNPSPLFIVNNTINASGANAVVKYTKSDSKTIAFGGAGATINKSIDGSSVSYSDYIDLNGDRYPDIVGQSFIQYTTPLGGLQLNSIGLNTGLQKSNSNSLGVNLGGVFFHPFLATGKSGNQNNNIQSTASSKIASALSGLSGGYNDNNDNTDSNLYDVNGDGLPDKVNSDGTVYLNIGNGFSPQPINWGINSIQGSSSKTISLGGGFNSDNNSTSGGVNIAKTTTEQNNSLIDFNGDGLIDKVVKDGNNLNFYLNTGSVINLTNNQKVALPNDFLISSSVADSRGISGSYTFAPHIFAVFVPVCKIVFSVSANIGDGSSSVKSQWTDINGDGFIDYVSYDGNNVNIKLSNLGKINRLKTVANPLGGSFEIDYKHNEANFNHPGGKWVMASLVTDDGIHDDGNKSKTTFEYENGKYERYEREFLGFGKITTIDYLNNDSYRKSIEEYNNDNYFVENELSKKWIEDRSGSKYNFEEYEYYAKLRTKANQTNVSPPLPSTFMKVAVMQTPLKTKKVFTYEGTVKKILLNQTEFKYDSLLNVISYSFKEGNNSQQQDNSFYKADIIYKAIDKPSNIYGLATSAIVKNKDGKILKKVKAYYPFTLAGSDGTSKYYGNKIQSDTIFFSDNKFATTIYDYDKTCGNLLKKTFPDGRFDSFEYDNKFNTYITTIKDPYGLENTFKYDFKIGLDTLRTLTNGATTKTKYDAFGRIVKIQGPNQSTVNINDADYTIKIKYNPFEKTPNAIVKHFDEVNKDDGIYTINFIDGFNKNIQIKKTGIINGIKQWIVSGRQTFDELYRVNKSYYPTYQQYDINGDMNIGDIGRTLKSDTDNITPTITNYDVLDRLATTKLPNGKLFETDSYSIGKDGFDNDARVTTTTYTNDTKLNKKEIYTNGSGLISTEIYYQVANNDSIKKVTKYHYDPIHQLDSVFNKKNKSDFIVITNLYDWACRKKQYYNISGGVTSYGYDNLNNLESKITAKNDTINYNYDHTRLIRIKYPKHPEDSVRYVYGEKLNTGGSNNVGKVVFQVDATGAQSFTYDVFGNIVSNRRTIIAPFDTTYTFTTKYEYDSWGRLMEMIYPGGEAVEYRYDIAGNLIKVFGSKYNTNAIDFSYVNAITYDKFEQRKSIEYGNGLATIYMYDDTLRRLKSVQTKKGNSEWMLSTYKYDDLNNVTENINKSGFPDMKPVTMIHTYTYDNQNQLLSGVGNWNNNGDISKYTLDLNYDDQFNISTRSLDLVSQTIKRNISSNYSYKTNNPLQLDAVQDIIVRSNTASGSKYKEKNIAYHNYDPNGNDIITNMADSFQDNVNERKILWDEENRIRAISTNGYVSCYTYDANGERTIKLSNEIEGVYINGLFAADNTNTATYSLYVNPYFSVRNARGIGTKHIYIGKERIVSQLTDYTTWSTATTDVIIKQPETDTVKLTEDLVPKNKIIPVGYIKKMYKTEALMNSYFDSLQVPHKIIAHNAFHRFWPSLNYPVMADPANQYETGTVNSKPDINEKLRYFYHSNYLGSTSFVSDLSGAVVQYIEYLPFGGTFMEQRKNYNSQFIFNGKEQDQETSLYYYGARYYDPNTYQWLGVDPMAEKHAGLSPYNFTLNNPVILSDPDGNDIMPRVMGALRTVGGVTFASGSAAFGTASSWTVIGALGGALGVAYGADQAATGYREMISGNYESSLGAKVIQTTTGLSEASSNIAYDAIGLLGFGMPSGVVGKAPVTLLSSELNISKTGLQLESSIVAKEVQYTKSNLQLGQQMHKAYKEGAEGIKEFILPSGRRIDFLDIKNSTIYELKPFNPRAMTEGRKQLNMYMQELQTMPQFQGVDWKTVLDTY